MTSGVLEGVEGAVLAYCSASRLTVELDLNCQGLTLEIDEGQLDLGTGSAAGQSRRLPDQIPSDATRSVIEWLRGNGNDADYWMGEARRAWERAAAEPARRVEHASTVLAQSLANHAVNWAPKQKGDLYGALLADAIGQVDWRGVAAWLLDRAT